MKKNLNNPDLLIKVMDLLTKTIRTIKRLSDFTPLSVFILFALGSYIFFWTFISNQSWIIPISLLASFIFVFIIKYKEYY